MLFFLKNRFCRVGHLNSLLEYNDITLIAGRSIHQRTNKQKNSMVRSFLLFGLTLPAFVNEPGLTTG